MWGQCLPTPVGARQEASPSMEAGVSGLPSGAKPSGPWWGTSPPSREGRARWDRGGGGGEALATKGLSRSSCPQASGSTVEGRRRGGGYCTVLRQPPLSSPS